MRSKRRQVRLRAANCLLLLQNQESDSKRTRVLPSTQPGQLSVQNQAEDSVFLNVPYDAEFARLFLGYIAGVSAFGMLPRTTLEIPGGERRLDRILSLIGECRYSVHDLSRVQLDRRAPRTPRFNMPFELGLSVAQARWSSQQHTFFVFETKRHRLSKSLSDLDGTDPYIHGGILNGLFAQMGNAFVRSKRQPTVTQMFGIYRNLRASIPRILATAGAESVFGARVFRDLSSLAIALANQIIPTTLDQQLR